MSIPFEHITVQEHKKAVKVFSWGSYPVFRDKVIQKRGQPAVEVIIPDGFKCETKDSGVIFLAETKVAHEGARAEYRFTVKSSGAKGSWAPTPTGALDDIHSKINNSKHRRGYNGCLVVGVTYPNLQRRIRDVLALDYDKEQAIPGDIHNPDNDQPDWRMQVEIEEHNSKRQRTSCDAASASSPPPQCTSTDCSPVTQEYSTEEDDSDSNSVFDEMPMTPDDEEWIVETVRTCTTDEAPAPTVERKDDDEEFIRAVEDVHMVLQLQDSMVRQDDHRLLNALFDHVVSQTTPLSYDEEDHYLAQEIFDLLV